jgi:hypothetical protein
MVARDDIYRTLGATENLRHLADLNSLYPVVLKGIAGY